MSRNILVVTHLGRGEAVEFARATAADLASAGLAVLVPEDEFHLVDSPGVRAVPVTPDGCAEGEFELVVVIGGDGTVLRAAERARGCGAPLLGVNLGHVGFLAEAEAEERAAIVSAVISGSWHVEERLALQASVLCDGSATYSTWALNEISIEKSARSKMLEIGLEIDGQRLSEWGCDGIVCATPTGSTAYAFSAGGPVVWPEVEALLMVPISAHALFARPLVVSPSSRLAVTLLPRAPEAVLFADGRRTVEIEPGSRVEITRSQQPVRFARLHDVPFTGRLVAKFDLPVTGWRGP